MRYIDESNCHLGDENGVHMYIGCAGSWRDECAEDIYFLPTVSSRKEVGLCVM